MGLQCMALIHTDGEMGTSFGIRYSSSQCVGKRPTNKPRQSKTDSPLASLSQMKWMWSNQIHNLVSEWGCHACGQCLEPCAEFTSFAVVFVSLLCTPILATGGGVVMSLQPYLCPKPIYVYIYNLLTWTKYIVNILKSLKNDFANAHNKINCK